MQFPERKCDYALFLLDFLIASSKILFRVAKDFDDLMCYNAKHQKGKALTFMSLCYPALYPSVTYKQDFGELISMDIGRNIILYAHTEQFLDINHTKIKNTNDIIAYGTITGIEKIQLAQYYENAYIYVIHCNPYDRSTGEKAVYVLEREFGNAAMIDKLKTQGGMVFPSKKDHGKIAKLIVDYLTACNLIKEFSLPYYSGWHQDEFFYCSEKSALNIDSPYLNNILVADTEVNTEVNTDVAIHNVYNTIKQTRNSHSLILFMLMIYGMLYSVFSEANLYIKRLINLSGSMADKAAQFMKIYNKDNMNFIGLNCSIPNLKKRISKSKDEVLIFKGRLEETKASLLCDIFCHGIYPDVKIGGKTVQLVRQSLCLVISNLMSGLVPPELMWEFNIESFDSDIDVPSFGITIKYLIKTSTSYKRENKFSEIIQRYSNIDKDYCSESEKDEFIILNTIFEFISAAFDVYGLDINELFPDDCDYDFIDDLVFNNCIETSEDVIIRKSRDMFTDIALHEPSLQEYTAGMEIDKSNELPVLYDSKNMYLLREKFSNISKKYFPDHISSVKLLRILYDEEALQCNNGNSMRLSVKISGNKSYRSDWIGIKRSFFEFPYGLPLFPCSDIMLESDYKPILLGSDASNRNIFIPVCSKALINNHIGIMGNSGTGKSNATISLINELSKQNIPVIVVDSANSLNKDISSEGFRMLIEEDLRMVSVRKDKVPINPFAMRSKSESEIDAIMRGSNILANAFGLNDNQKHLICQIAMTLNKSGNVSLKRICDTLKSDNTNNKQTAQACLNKLFPIAQMDILNESDRTINWNIYTKNSVVYFSMDSIPDDGCKQAIGEFILSDIWTYVQQYGDKSTPLAIIFDEVGNFPITGSSALTKMMKEGRKYGIMCIWNTQSFGTKFNSEQRATLSQAATMLYFNSSEPKEVEYISNRLPDNGKLLEYLEKSGQCIAYGAFCDDNNNTYLKKELYVKIPLVNRKTKTIG